MRIEELINFMIAFLDSTFTKSFALSLTFLFGASGLYPEKFKFTSRRWFCIGLIIWSLFTVPYNIKVHQNPAFTSLCEVKAIFHPPPKGRGFPARPQLKIAANILHEG